MFKRIFVVLKKIVLSILFIYTYNKLTLPLDIVIPINVFSVSLVSLFGIPSIIMLILFSLLCL
ncbi:MAG: pro-sigmaK processing inhibitor BofA family protein [Bacilli bacterium]|jgi:hypothetical protein|nr:pro-sigmaK processing inhibitor BofA family protein [Clostridium sp.]MDY3798726.1 pro-sigmaK processing inhibitor BofA family protein [Bacilli bacterium]